MNGPLAEDTTFCAICLQIIVTGFSRTLDTKEYLLVANVKIGVNV